MAKNATKTNAKKPSSKAAAGPKRTAVRERMSKTELVAAIMDETGLEKKQVNAVLASLGGQIERHIKPRGCGEFVLPGLLKIKTIKKPAQKARKNVPNPFRPGETMDVAAKPARTVVKAQPLKGLKDLAAWQPHAPAAEVLARLRRQRAAPVYSVRCTAHRRYAPRPPWQPQAVSRRVGSGDERQGGAAAAGLAVGVEGLGDMTLLRSLGDLFGLHPLALEDVINTHQWPKTEEYEDHVFIVTRVPVDAAPADTASAAAPGDEQLSLFLGERYLLTFQEGRPGDSLEPVRDRLRRRRGRLRSAGADYLAYALLDAVIDA